MDIIITNEGDLKIKRGNTYCSQFCPYGVGSGKCGSWCPLFGEPVLIHALFPDTIATSEISICNGKVLVGNVTDERIRVK